jgi:hypothetical protein
MSSDGSDKVLSALGLRKVALAEDLRTVESVINNAECAEVFYLFQLSARNSTFN